MEKIKTPNIKQEQIHGILFSREIGWQEIIYDLINTEQLDPWDIDILVLTEKYMEKIRELEEADFLISSKVLLAAALLLRIKSEILLNKYIKSIDEILFGKKEKPSQPISEKIDLNEEIPELIPKSPMPRFKRVGLNELIEALNKAMITENRRIKKEIISKNALREAGMTLPKMKFRIKDRINQILSKILSFFAESKQEKKIHYHTLAGETKEERISHLLPLLHLEHQKKIWLEQKEHFGEIQVWERKSFWETHGDPFKELKEMQTEIQAEAEENVEEAGEDEKMGNEA